MFFVFLPFQIDALVVTAKIFTAGFFNPYASHFVYLSDLFLFLGLFVLGIELLLGRKKIKFKIFSSFLTRFLGLFVGTYFLSILFAFDPLNSLMYGLRMLEFFAVYLLFKGGVIEIRRVMYVFVGVVTFSAFIGIAQYFLQESLGLRFFGEPVISSTTLGVAKVTLPFGNLLRAYGTFPHPNIFAGYLIFAIFMSLYLIEDSKSVFGLTMFLCLMALLLTFSRSGYLAFVFALMLYLSTAVRGKSLKLFFYLGALVLLLIIGFDLFPAIFQRFTVLGDSLSERLTYMVASQEMLSDNLLGVGAGNFTLMMQEYSVMKLLPWLLQPVHNIYLLSLSELGLIGGGVFIALFFVVFKILFNKKKEKLTYLLTSLLVVIFIVGFFDHYFLSLYQGQALLWIYLGMVGVVEG